MDYIVNHPFLFYTICGICLTLIYRINKPKDKDIEL